MSIKEVFPNSLVTSVIFQIRFPNLFYLESKIGDFQVEVMKKFPKSSLLLKNHVIFAEGTGKEYLSEIVENSQQTESSKVWQFNSENNVKLNVTNGTLDLSSSHHKTYNLGDTDKFRDAIEFVLEKFFKVVTVPVITRVGLRYVDDCPLPEKLNNEEFSNFYNTGFPLDRFEIGESAQMATKVITKVNNHFLSFVADYQKKDDSNGMTFDYDAFSLGIEPSECLSVTDELHEILSNAFEDTINEPVFEYMRKKE